MLINFNYIHFKLSISSKCLDFSSSNDYLKLIQVKFDSLDLSLFYTHLVKIMLLNSTQDVKSTNMFYKLATHSNSWIQNEYLLLFIIKTMTQCDQKRAKCLNALQKSMMISSRNHRGLIVHSG